MLTIERSKKHRGKCTPNVLPCRINHNGPVDASKRYWNPHKTSGNSSHPAILQAYTNAFPQMAKQSPISEEENCMENNSKYQKDIKAL